MAITAYTGPPGAGKSYALVSQIILEGVKAGRRVVTNIAGVKPDAVREYAAQQAKKPVDEMGTVVLFEGRKALEPGFFPTEDISDAGTFIKGGDLLVFDEWKLVFPSRTTPPGCDIEPFLRWHRHLVDGEGRASDVVIGTQLITDINRDYRGLVERSFKFKNLKAVGLAKSYVAEAYEGSTQPKGGSYRTINGKYKKEVFALYQSYSTDGEGKESQTDKRAAAFGKGVWVAFALGVPLFGLCLYYIVSYFSPDNPQPEVSQISQAQRATGPVVPAKSPLRIVGHYVGDQGLRVIVGDDKGTMRILRPEGFNFDGERPVSGMVDGLRVEAADRVYIGTEKPMELQQ